MSSSPDDIFRPLPPLVDRPEAERLLDRRRWRLRRPPRRVGLELVRLPVYVVEARMTMREDATQTPVRLAIDAIDGAVQRLDRRLRLDEDPRNPAAAGVADGVLPATLSEDAALERGRRELQWLVLGFALRRGAAYRSKGLELTDRIGWPYWVLHLERGGRRSFRAVEGLGARLLGARGRRTLAAGFVLAARRLAPGVQGSAGDRRSTG